RELAGNALGDAATVIGIEPIMRIAKRVNVAFGARYLALGNLEDLGKLRCIEIAVTARLDSSIAALRDQRRQPADFKIQANADQQIGVAQLEEKAGLGLNEVRILVAFGESFYINLIAADLAGKRGEVSQRGNDSQFFGFGGSRRQKQ